MHLIHWRDIGVCSIMAKPAFMIPAQPAYRKLALPRTKGFSSLLFVFNTDWSLTRYWPSECQVESEVWSFRIKGCQILRKETPNYI